MRSTFPDAYVTLEDVIAEDDRLERLRTHPRVLPPTGKQVTFSVIHIETAMARLLIIGF